MKIFLGKAGKITADTVAHLHVDNVIIYSVIYIAPFTNDDICIYKTFVYSMLPEDN
jgi:hypothetical protein